MFAKSAVMGIDSGAFVDAALFLMVAWGIHRCSRIAAVLGLVLYLFERANTAYVSVTSSGSPNPVMLIVITVAFVNSVRGTFAFHRFKQDKTADCVFDSSGTN